MDQYASYLEDICRVGGKKFTSCSQSTRHPVTSVKGEHLSVHKIDISTDDPLVHPQYICVLCQRALQRTKSKSIATDSNVSVQHRWLWSTMYMATAPSYRLFDMFIL